MVHPAIGGSTWCGRRVVRVLGKANAYWLLKASGIDLGGVRCPQVNLSDEVLRDVDDRLRETGVLDYVTHCQGQAICN